jgi:hypothetical protein
MQRDERDLLEVLKVELNFLEKGGYGRSPREPWRPQFIFEDSPTCMNYDCKEHPDPCSNCVLMQLVPPECRAEKIPCRHIPLDASGQTLDSLYRSEDQHKIEETVGNWLRSAIERLEEGRRVFALEGNTHLPPAGDAMKGTPLYENLHPKCANPACPNAFHWLEGGKFFRFHEAPADPRPPAADSPANLHAVKHFWLCERCSHIFTLVYAEQSGVTLRLLWPELPAVETHKSLTAA